MEKDRAFAKPALKNLPSVNKSRHDPRRLAAAASGDSLHKGSTTGFVSLIRAALYNDEETAKELTTINGAVRPPIEAARPPITGPRDTPAVQ